MASEIDTALGAAKTRADQERQFVRAALLGWAYAVKHFVDAGVNVNAQDEDGMTPLHCAASVGSRACVRLLLASGRCDYLLQDRKGRYASDLAMTWARDHAMARLLRKKQRQQAFVQGVPAWEPPKRNG